VPEGSVWVQLVAAVLSAVAGGIATLIGFDAYRLAGLLRGKSVVEPSRAERMARMTADLQATSLRLDDLIGEMAVEAESRSEEVEAMKRQLEKLAVREKDLTEQIAALEGVRPAAVDRFAEILREAERRGTKRDVMFFFAGVFVTTFVSVALTLLF
jgi:hypothetical protein